MADQAVKPDNFLLQQIFQNDGQPTSTSILLQDWDKCIFRADFANGRPSLVARIEAQETQSGTFATIAALQEVARIVIPELVPPTYKLGTAKNEEGREFQYSVIGIVTGDTLEEVWEKIGDHDRVSIVAEIASAVAKLHSVRIGDYAVQEIFRALLLANDLRDIQQPDTFGGPLTGFLKDGPALLNALLARRKAKKSFCSILPSTVSQASVIKSNYDDLGSVTIKDSEMSTWVEEAVFCHNDLTPRNLIISSSLDHNGVPKYRLGGIIDWELSGFYPASYELSLQDTYLGLGNRHISFYLLLKEHLTKLVPRTPSQIGLLNAVELIYESQQRCLLEGFNVPALIRKRFLERGELVRNEDRYRGWTSTGGPSVDIDKDAYQNLVNQAIEEISAKRRAATSK